MKAIGILLPIKEKTPVFLSHRKMGENSKGKCPRKGSLMPSSFASLVKTHSDKTEGSSWGGLCISLSPLLWSLVQLALERTHALKNARSLNNESVSGWLHSIVFVFLNRVQNGAASSWSPAEKQKYLKTKRKKMEKY